MVQIQKKKKMADQVWKKRFFRRCFSHHFNHREIPQKNQRENSWQDVSVIFLKIYPQQQNQWHKNSLYIYWECLTIYSNSYLKLHNTHLLRLFVDIYILKNLKKKNIILLGSFSPLRNFKKWGQNLYFWFFKIAFDQVIFQYLKNKLTKIVYWPH